jgi:transposase
MGRASIRWPGSTSRVGSTGSRRRPRSWASRRGRCTTWRRRARSAPAYGRPPTFDPEIYLGRNVVDHCFNKFKNWRGIAMRSDKTARGYHAAICLAATLIWIRSDLSNTP